MSECIEHDKAEVPRLVWSNEVASLKRKVAYLQQELIAWRERYPHESYHHETGEFSQDL